MFKERGRSVRPLLECSVVRIAAWLLTGSLLLLSACSELSSPTEPAGPRLGVAFRLSPGGSVSIEGEPVRVGFERVTVDNRCPTDISCFWEGFATAALRFDVAGEPAAVELSTSGPRTVERSGYRLELRRVTPERRTQTDRIEPSSYRVELVVTR